VEARYRSHCPSAQDLTHDWHPPHSLGSTEEVGEVLGNEVKRFSLVVASAIVLVGCSSGDAADYTAFCTKAAELEVASQDAHLDDPSAISDTKAMRKNWTAAVARAVELRDASPDRIKEDVTLMVSTLIDMDKVFQKHDYNLLEMAKSEKIRNELDAISARKGVPEASERFNSFMSKNCGQQ